MKTLINSDFLLARMFRKSYLKKLHHVVTTKVFYCCHVNTWHRLFICWKDLKEVKENMTSIYLKDHVRENIEERHCANVWFSCMHNRKSFLEECLKNFK